MDHYDIQSDAAEVLGNRTEDISFHGLVDCLVEQQTYLSDLTASEIDDLVDDYRI